MAKKIYIKSSRSVAARPRSERLRRLGSTTTGSSTGTSGLESATSEGLTLAEVDAHITANWFARDTDGNIYPVNNAGFYSNSFVSAKGADATSSGGGLSGGGISEGDLWNILQDNGTEKIAANHIPDLAYAAESHTHTVADVTDIESWISGKGFITSHQTLQTLTVQGNGTTIGTYTPSSASTINITPAGIGAAASSHTHEIADVDGLQTALNGKASSSHSHSISAVTGKQSLTIVHDGGSATAANKTYNVTSAVTITIPTTLPASDVQAWAKAATKPTYSVSEITGLDDALAGKSDTTHGHVIVDIDGLQDALNDKQDAGNYVTTDTAQTITGAKTIDNDLVITGNLVVEGTITSATGISSDGYVSAKGVDASSAGSAGSTLAICSTDAATAAKTADAGTSFVLALGACVRVVFTSANTASSPTLNVSGSGAKAIYMYKDGALVALPFVNWQAGTALDLWYNGTYWVIAGNPVMYCGTVTGTNYMCTARCHADGYKEFGFVTTAEAVQYTFQMPFPFSNISTMAITGSVLHVSTAATPTFTVRVKTVNSVGVDFDTSSTSALTTVGCSIIVTGY